jgi:hypothetical protein
VEKKIGFNKFNILSFFDDLQRKTGKTLLSDIFFYYGYKLTKAET